VAIGIAFAMSMASKPVALLLAIAQNPNALAMQKNG
jgi:hypothetical protein